MSDQIEKQKESRQQIGIRLANQRMPKLEKLLEQVGNLAAYGLSAKHISLMDKAIVNWTAKVRSRLNGTERNSEETFKLE